MRGIGDRDDRSQTGTAGKEASAAQERPRLMLLDGFRLVVADEEIVLPHSAERLVAFLALHRRPLSRTYAAGFLWPDSRQARSFANLRSALWRARKAGVQVVQTTRTGLGLTADLTVDVEEVMSTVQRLIDPTSPCRPDDLDVTPLTRELLPSWLSDDWVLIEREQLRQRCLLGLEALCRRLLTMGRVAKAVEAGLAAVCGEPLRESAHRALISAYVAEGNEGEALRQYRRYRELLRAELGLEPSGQIDRLISSLRRAAVS